MTGHPLGRHRGDRGRDGRPRDPRRLRAGPANLEAPEPELDALLPGLLREGWEARVDRVLSTSFGFGGLNAALVLGAPGRHVAPSPRLRHRRPRHRASR